MTENVVNVSSQATTNTVAKQVAKTRKIRLDTLLKYLVAFVKHDTWTDLLNAGYSISTSNAIMKFGMQNGFIKREPEIKGNRVVLKIKVIEGTYKIKLADGEEYTLAIKSVGNNRLRFEVSKEVEIK